MLTLVLLLLFLRAMNPWRRYRPWGMFPGVPFMWRRPPMRFYGLRGRGMGRGGFCRF